MTMIQDMGLNKQKVEQFLKKGITTTEQLAAFFPRKYLDMRVGHAVKDVEIGENTSIDGCCICKDSSGMYPKVTLRDANLDEIDIIWFGNSLYYYDQFIVGNKYRVYGKLGVNWGVYQIKNPSLFFEIGKGETKLYPVYSKIKGMSDQYLQGAIEKAIAVEEAHRIPTKKDIAASQLGLASYFDAVKMLHNPKDERAYKRGKTRMAFEVIYDFYVDLRGKRRAIGLNPSIKIGKTEQTLDLIRALPFTLTEGQQKVVDHIINEAIKQQRIDMLITGDVGCGKTMVALIAAILMWENGFQTAIMAPTLILAKQHYEEMVSRIPAGWETSPRFALLTSETKKRERTKILKGLESGEIDILIGTSSVISDELDFSSLGMTIIDEEHKFGAEQKAVMEKKCQSGLHHIAMTATPIPRSIARTVYGNDFGVMAIETLPKGRKPVITEQSSDKKAMFERLADEVKAGHQAYIVCPFVSDSESERFQDVDSVESTQEKIEQQFSRAHPQIRIDSINGRMKQSAILSKTKKFANGEIDILISTTIVEVGVNVPNATAIMIMSADRFGLAALHQLRGRVGRAGDQGYCFLMTKNFSEKLSIMCQTTNGFRIAEEDLKLRGPGDLTGEAQTGYSEAIDLILKRPKMAERVREIVWGK